MKTLNIVAKSDSSIRVFSIEAKSFEPVDVVIGLLKKSHPLVEHHPDFAEFVAHYMKDVIVDDEEITIKLSNVTYHATPVQMAVYTVSVKTHAGEYREIRVKATSPDVAKATTVLYLDTLSWNEADLADVMDIVGVDPPDSPAMIKCQ
jgi:hypothetical protein